MSTCHVKYTLVPRVVCSRYLPGRAADTHWLLGIGLWFLLAAAQAGDLAWQDVIERARERAAAPYQPEPARVPDWLLELDYPAWQDIRFDPSVALWAGQELPFSVRFHHPGSIYRQPVAIREVDEGQARALHFEPQQFFYGPGADRQRVPGDLGYAGFTVYAQKGGNWQPVLEFLGGSFMRAGAPLTAAGARTRALAIDTALPSGEEFPVFTDFWLLRPAAKAGSLVIYALLDSPRVSGAYRIELMPGAKTVTQVRSQLFFREAVNKLGLGPLSSMFWYGENSPAVDDYRPEVHSSDGLLLQAGRRWLWRPLANLPRFDLQTLPLAAGDGYGLMQRDREFDHYQDIDAAYEQAPGVFLRPKKGFGPGSLELLELPVRDGFNQNVLAYFVPGRTFAAGDHLTLEYDIFWGASEPGPRTGRVLATRSAPLPGETGITQYQIDFAPLERGDKPQRTAIDIDGGTLRQQRLRAWGDGWRLILAIKRQDGMPLTVRAGLVAAQGRRSETWIHHREGE